MEELHLLAAEDFTTNPFQAIGKDLMLITAAKDGKVNTMTAGWGGLGVMFGKNAAFIVIRESRYTKEFVDGSDMAVKNVFKGSGDMMAFLMTTVGSLGVRVACAMILCPLFGETMIWWSLAIGWITATIPTIMSTPIISKGLAL